MMNKMVIILLFLFTGIAAQQPIILVMKTAARSGLEAENDALPEIVTSKLSKYQGYRFVVWNEIESKLGKEKMTEINRCQDSACIVGFTEVVKQYKLNPSYMLFCSIAKYEADYSITLKIADAIRGTVFGMVSTTSSNLESFHSSGIIESVMRKIPAYVSRTTNTSPVNIPVFVPGTHALGSDTNYFSILINDLSELKLYVDFFNQHDNRKKLLVNTIKPLDTVRFPSVAVFKPDRRDSLTKKTLIAISFTDSISKSTIESPVSIFFNNGNSNIISQIVLKCAVPSQSRFATDYLDMKKILINKISKSGFNSTKADSSSGLYGVSYHYYFTKKSNLFDVNLSFSADVSTFTVVIEKEQ